MAILPFMLTVNQIPHGAQDSTKAEAACRGLGCFADRNTILYYTVLYYTVLYYVILYYVMRAFAVYCLFKGARFSALRDCKIRAQPGGS